MKTGLQLLLVIALAFLAFLVARIEYYRGFALYHQHQANRYAELIRIRRNITPLEVELAIEIAAQSPEDSRLSHRFRGALYHRAAAVAYQEAAYHPWLFVEAPIPPGPIHED
jgi:hypothetical protein